MTDREDTDQGAASRAQIELPSAALSRLALREGNAKKPVYMMHKWWARRLGVVFRMLLLRQAAEAGTDEKTLWRRFYSPHALPAGFVVLDPFLGGGTTLVEAAKQGASCIGADIDPVACFVTDLELRPPEADAVEHRFKEIEEALAPELLGLYRTRVDGELVDIVYYFWVDRVSCLGCGALGDAHPTYQIACDVADNWQVVICPCCGALERIALDRKLLVCRSCETRTRLDDVPVRYGSYTCARCGEKRSMRDLWKGGSATHHLIAHEYVAPNGRRAFAAASAADRAAYTRACTQLSRERAELPLPDDNIPAKGRSDRRPRSYGYRRYEELFNPRQLLALGRIAAAIRATEDERVRHALTLAFSHSLATNNMFCSYAFSYRRLCPIFSVHAFRKVTRPVEGNVWGIDTGRGSFKNAVRAVAGGSRYMHEPYEYRYTGEARRPDRVSVTLAKPRTPPGVQILNRSSEDLSPIASGSVDLVLTDPPYFDNISYSELSDFYHVWLRRMLGREYVGHGQAHTPMTTAIYGGPRGSGADPERRYSASLIKVFRECKRVLKPRGSLVFTFHHRSARAWKGLGQALLSAGFEVTDVCRVGSEGRSGLHSYEGTLKWDAVFVCRARRGRRVPRTSATVAELADAAERASRDWAAHLRRSRLEYSESDQRSFAMANVLKVFSERATHRALLDKVLKRVAGTDPEPEEDIDDEEG